MTLTSTDNSLSIFKDGKLKPGPYKIQNIFSETYLDFEVHSREICCRLGTDLGEGKGIVSSPYLRFVSDGQKWEIKPLGAGYTINRVEPGKPVQFCAPMVGLEDHNPLSVSAYPVGWRIEVVNDDIYRGHEFVRFYWGTTKKIWNIHNGTSTRVGLWTVVQFYPWFIWRLIPVGAEGAFTPSRSSYETLGSRSLPPYDEGGTGRPPAHAQHQHAESEHDDFGTIVTEVTVLTTGKRYRVEDA